MDTTKFELKYCELCGALGLRHTETSENYCRSCEELLTQRVVARHSSRRGPTAKPNSESALPLQPAVKLEVLQ
jgi:hypothetical protein